MYKGREEGQWVGLVCREGGVCVVMPCHCPLTIPSLLPPLCRSLVLATQGHVTDDWAGECNTHTSEFFPETVLEAAHYN